MTYCTFKPNCIYRSRQSQEKLKQLDSTICDNDFSRCEHYRIQITMSPHPEKFFQVITGGNRR